MEYHSCTRDCLSFPEACMLENKIEKNRNDVICLLGNGDVSIGLMPKDIVLNMQVSLSMCV